MCELSVKVAGEVIKSWNGVKCDDDIGMVTDDSMMTSEWVVEFGKDAIAKESEDSVLWAE